MSDEGSDARPSRARVVGFLVEGLRALLAERGEPLPDDLGEGTRLVGPQAALTSLGLVSLIVELEQTLEEQYGVCLTLADERAMSQRHSPFRTVGTLADYACRLLAEQAA
jgi:acyl carrier protein